MTPRRDLFCAGRGVHFAVLYGEAASEELRARITTALAELGCKPTEPAPAKPHLHAVPGGAA